MGTQTKSKAGVDNDNTSRRMALRYRSLMHWLGMVVPLAVLVTAVATFAAGILVPLYSDEIAVQMTRSRFLVEGAHLVSLLPQCRSTILLSVPATWYPAALLNALLYFGADGIGLRVLGIVLGLAWLSLLWFWAGQHPQNFLPKRSFQALALSFNLLGVLPFVLILARTEQLLVLTLAGFCLFALYWNVESKDGRLSNYLKAFLFLVLTSVCLFSHPKALFFAPLILASAWMVFKHTGKGLKLLVYSSVLFAIYQTFQQAEKLTSCPNAPQVAKILAKNTLDFHQYIINKIGFFYSVWVNLISAPTHITSRIPITSQYQSFWLPTIDGGITPLFKDFGVIVQLGVLLLIIALFAGLAYQVLGQLKRKVTRPSTILGVALAAGIVIHAIIYDENSWNFYTPGLIIPLLSMLFLVVIPERITTKNTWITSIDNLIIPWLLFALTSMSMLLHTMVPPLLGIASEKTLEIANQPLSTPIFLPAQEKDNLQALAAECHITKKSTRLVLGGLSYFEYKDNKQPLNVLYVSNFGFGMDVGQNALNFLHKIDSGGVLTRCEFLQRDLLNSAHKSGIMCCVSKSVWQ